MFCELLHCINKIFYQYLLYYKSIKNPSFSNKKALQQKCQRAGNVRLPGQDDYRTFCMSEETEKVCQRLEEVINT